MRQREIERKSEKKLYITSYIFSPFSMHQAFLFFRFSHTAPWLFAQFYSSQSLFFTSLAPALVWNFLSHKQSLRTLDYDAYSILISKEKVKFNALKVNPYTMNTYVYSQHNNTRITQPWGWFSFMILYFALFASTYGWWKIDSINIIIVGKKKGFNRRDFFLSFNTFLSQMKSSKNVSKSKYIFKLNFSVKKMFWMVKCK